MVQSDVTISPFAASDANALDDIDRIFFEASSVRSFPSDAKRAAFREVWLGRYLDRLPEHAYVAASSGRVIGYIVGAVEADPMFQDVPSNAVFSDLLPRFPAHLHVNVAAGAREAGVGSRLIEAFLAHLRRLGVTGVHLVTSEGSRNIGFYVRNGFRIEASRPANDRVLVFMGRAP